MMKVANDISHSLSAYHTILDFGEHFTGIKTGITL